MARRPALVALARHLGVIPAYRDAMGRQHVVPTSTLERIVSAMGFDASNESAALERLSGLRQTERTRLLPPTCMIEHAAADASVDLRLPRGAQGSFTWSIVVRLDSGEECTAGGRIGRGTGSAIVKLRLPRHLSLGCHDLRLHLRHGGVETIALRKLIVAPRSVVGGHRAREFGISANLYTVRSDTNWGVGDLSDLRRLASWCGDVGGSFVGINPLHALLNREPGISPYSPVTRLFANPLYLDIEAVPEFEHCREARALHESNDFRRRLAQLRSADRVDYAASYRLKIDMLRLLHDHWLRCVAPGRTARARAYRVFCDEQQPLLDRFAVFCAIRDQVSARNGATDWHLWPAEYRNCVSGEVAEFRRRHDRELDFHRYVQFELDRQIRAAHEALRRRGRLGLYVDVALGSSADGFDAWAFADQFVPDMNVGAPPDSHSADGQDWSFPPLNPHALREAGFGYWRELLSRTMRHCGMCRIDHAMSLRRLFWIPKGEPASRGAYVRYPEAELISLLVLESARQGVIPVGEDLGTVPPGFSAGLHRKGIRSIRLMYFERDRKGSFRPGNRYTPCAVASVSNHDHAPLLGFLEGHDVALRRGLSLLTAREAAQQMQERERTRERLIDRLRLDGLLPSSSPDGKPVRGRRAATGRKRPPNEPTDAAIVDAVHRWIAATSSEFVALMLDDLCQEREPVNLPGVWPSVFASWSRRMRMSLEGMIGQGTGSRSRTATASHAKPSKSRRAPARSVQTKPPALRDLLDAVARLRRAKSRR